jgi:hypothetical protein
MSSLEEYSDAERFEDPADDTPSDHIEITGDKATSMVLNPILLKVDTIQFVISLNDRPLFCVSNENSAHIKMWVVARLLIKERQVKDPNFQHYIKTTTNELIVTCIARVYFVAYDTVAFRIRYDKIGECK